MRRPPNALPALAARSEVSGNLHRHRSQHTGLACEPVAATDMAIPQHHGFWAQHWRQAIGAVHHHHPTGPARTAAAAVVGQIHASATGDLQQGLSPVPFGQVLLPIGLKADGVGAGIQSSAAHSGPDLLTGLVRESPAGGGGDRVDGRSWSSSG